MCRVVKVINLSSISDWEVYFSRHFGRTSARKKIRLWNVILTTRRKKNLRCIHVKITRAAKSRGGKDSTLNLKISLLRFHGYINFFCIQFLSIRPLWDWKIQFANRWKNRIFHQKALKFFTILLLFSFLFFQYQASRSCRRLRDSLCNFSPQNLMALKFQLRARIFLCKD